MPEFNKDFIITINNLKDFIVVTYVIIDDFYQKVTPAFIMNRRNIDKSVMSDSEIITLSLVGELLTIDSEKAWFGFCSKNLRDLFPNFCSRTRFHRVRKSLFRVTDAIRKEFMKFLNYQYDRIRIVDSMPIPVCKFGRAHFHKSFKPKAAYGRCASKKETYYGFKLHALVALDGYITDFSITAANIDDRDAVWELIDNSVVNTLIGDKGYIGQKIASQLKEIMDINLLTISRNNSKIKLLKPLRQLIFKARRRIETTFSQLSEQLNIQRVLAKSTWGFATRIVNKILAHNLCYFINKILNIGIDTAKIKTLIFG
ncbi:IS982-like element ISClce1 family transposase [Clostridium cellulovorans]|uniref:Transposase IS4 family protein n=1 Tax=Clostridium cellulovorans (strain ATCC 35296 / DSM 3052 / OCM 3 / 743B) TaxID=573061 RepID=D9SMR4_CLOC7|nr:IS982-like element ISClce1 family transposase [Clostridium cellulovorans]ADL49849.1 transposase IS4 family protein [Clostridium cellulovorans 743B]ADL50375.1 transposase IS4 family protein [Clostridium cellulovorans 743B]ADL51895.1 transposase IS4 family protein [Clostridium cellulovorans 743B]ADL52631.1 transposase IS4 family protein [Clostridium cellulovorans 743B]ADL52951.1 transposase IS4 family protein [Clostridium cellulovorans 743B]